MTVEKGPNTLAAEGAILRMTLFVAGEEANSRLALSNLEDLCEEELAGRCEVEVIDVLEDQNAAVEYRILVTPTLVVTEPGPAVTLIGNLNDREKVRRVLRL